MKYRLTIIALVIGICIGVYFSSSGSHAAPPVQTWEYKVMLKKCNEEKTLNALGADGWELATYSTWALSAGSVDTCVFKRAK